MCYNPITLHTPSGNTLQVPCGHCLACLHKYQQDVCIRLSEEVDTWIHQPNGEVPIVFATLTYSENNIPKNYVYNTSQGPRVVRDALPKIPSTSEVVSWNGLVKDFILEKDAQGKVIRVTPKKEFQERVLAIEERFKFFAALSSSVSDIVEDTSFDLPLPQEVDVEGLGALHPSAFLSEGEKFRYFFDVHPEEQIIGDVVEVNSVRYEDVCGWIKRCRMAFERARSQHIITYQTGDYRPVRVSDRLNPFWKDGSGRNHFLPYSALTPTVHYYLTSEYGPVTLRPHYHLVLFGITLDEFKEYFAKDWESRFGHVDCSQFDPMKGGALYLSKYCSKGSYEHPLCSRDFFYPSGKEFHSKRFEGSIQRFGVDMAICDKTFHLSSKGLGIRYAFSPSIQTYWKVRLVEDSYNRRPFYCVEDLHPSKLSTMDMSKVSFAVNSKTNVAIFSDVNQLTFLQLSAFSERGNYVIEDYKQLVLTSLLRINKNGQITARSTFFGGITYSVFEESAEATRKYVSTYLKKDKDGSLASAIRISALPRYYHRYLLSPASRCARVASAIRLYDGIFEQKRQEVRQSGRQGYVSLDEVCQVKTSFDVKEEISQKALRKCANGFYQVVDRQDLLDMIAYEQI